jgi:dolichyl-phosphate beta-glucosyltransferase
MSGEPYLSVVIPAYREELRLGAALEKIEAFRRTRPWTSEVIVVDDGSPDGTARVAGEFMRGKTGYRLIRADKNAGKGAAVRRGMEEATGKYRLFSDADLSTPIEEVEAFFPYLVGRGPVGVRYDVVVGSRRVAGARLEQRQPFHRELSGRIFSLLVHLLVFPGFLDTQCGFKMFTAEAARQIFRRQRITRFAFDVEAMFIALRVLGYKVKEAPVRWMDSPATTVRLFQDSMMMFKELFVIRKNYKDRVYQ